MSVEHSELQELYQDIILDHNRRPRNFRALAGGRAAHGDNPLCGDRLTVYVRLEDGMVADVSFQGSGCAISKASASLMTEGVKGKTMDEVRALIERFHRMLTGPDNEPAEHLGKLAAFAGVRQFPIRVKCATLAWHTLRAAIEARDAVVSTE